jgi:hypothetical protein
MVQNVGYRGIALIGTSDTKGVGMPVWAWVLIVVLLVLLLTGGIYVRR